LRRLTLRTIALRLNRTAKDPDAALSMVANRDAYRPLDCNLAGRQLP
jgi:hypothetical protein